MEYSTVTPCEDDNESMNEIILSEKEYPFILNDKKYSLLTSFWSKYVNFKFKESNKITFLYHENKCKLDLIIGTLNLDSKTNYKEILAIIDDAYLNNKISINFEKDNSIIIIIKCIIKNKEKQIDVHLKQKDSDIKEKFEIICNEINYLKNEKKDCKEEKKNELQKEFFDINDINNISNKKIKENLKDINILENKIKALEASLQIIQKQINILINEIIETKNRTKSSITEKKKIKFKEDLPISILICGNKIDKSFINPFLKEKNKLKTQNKDYYEEYNFNFGWKIKYFKEGLENSNFEILSHSIKNNSLDNNIILCFINDSLRKAINVITYFGFNFPKSDIFIVF